jgi:hypothetical protein
MGTPEVRERPEMDKEPDAGEDEDLTHGFVI